MAGKSGAEFRDGIVGCVGFGEPSDALLQLRAVSLRHYCLATFPFHARDRPLSPVFGRSPLCPGPGKPRTGRTSVQRPANAFAPPLPGKPFRAHPSTWTTDPCRLGRELTEAQDRDSVVPRLNRERLQ
jgi:hypothetical protein